MEIFGRKKKKSSSLPFGAIKDLSLITGAVLALSKAIQAKFNEQRHDLFRKEPVRDPQNTIMLITALIGGVVAGAITALLVAPESGDEFRGRISGMFGNGHDEEAAIEQASQKADELAETARLKAESAEQDLKSN